MSKTKNPKTTPATTTPKQKDTRQVGEPEILEFYAKIASIRIANNNRVMSIEAQPFDDPQTKYKLTSFHAKKGVFEMTATFSKTEEGEGGSLTDEITFEEVALKVDKITIKISITNDAVHELGAKIDQWDELLNFSFIFKQMEAFK